MGMRVKYNPNAVIEHNVKEGILVLEPGNHIRLNILLRAPTISARLVKEITT